MAKNGEGGGNTGLTGQPADKCVQLYELGYMVVVVGWGGAWGGFFPVKRGENVLCPPGLMLSTLAWVSRQPRRLRDSFQFICGHNGLN